MSTKHPLEIRNIVPEDLKQSATNVNELVKAFAHRFEPAEVGDFIAVYVDARTLARFAECHVPARKLVPLSTVAVPLDPEQPDYRANREIVTDHMAFRTMKEDAGKRRTFSNIVAEFITEYDPEHPLKIIGGQHRYEAIKEALDTGVDEYHGVKVYFGLTLEQRLDVQRISSTAIAVSSDSGTDRMQESGSRAQNSANGARMSVCSRKTSDYFCRFDASEVRISPSGRHEHLLSITIADSRSACRNSTTLIRPQSVCGSGGDRSGMGQGSKASHLERPQASGRWRRVCETSRGTTKCV